MSVLSSGLSQRLVACLGLCLAIGLAGCGNEADSELVAVMEAEIESVRETANADLATAESESQQEIDSLLATIAEAEAESASSADSVAELTQEVEAAAADLTEARDQVDALEGELQEATRQLIRQTNRADEAEASVVSLMAKYDVEIRADAQAAWDAELAAACEEAGDSTSAISRHVDHTDELAIIGTEEELIALVTACAEPLRNRSEQEKLSAECELGSVDAVTKDPEDLAGECFVIHVIPTQWDSRTGPCNFLGNWDPNNLGLRSYSYDGDGIFRAPPGVCDEDLAESDQDDLLQVWVDLTGPYRYDTAAGGTNEVPDFRIRRAVLIRKG